MSEPLAQILIVESNAPTRTLLQQTVKAAFKAITVEVANNLRQAKKLIAENKPAMVIVNYHLTDGLGTDLDPNKKQAPTLILIIEPADSAAVEAALAAGIDHIIFQSDTGLKLLPQTIANILAGIKHASQKQHLQTKLNTADEQFKTIFDQALDIILIIDGETGTILKTNPIISQLLGYTEAAIIGKHFSLLFEPETNQPAQSADSTLHFHNAVLESQRIVRADGSICLMDLTATITPWGAGTAIVATLRDVTERDAVKTLLEQHAAQLALINDIGRQIAAVLSLNSLLKQTANLVQTTFDYHHVAIFLIVDDLLALKAVAGFYENYFQPAHTQALNTGINGWVASHGRKIVANNVEEEARYISYIADHTITRAELCLPIKMGNETIGILDIQSPRLNAFSKNDIIAMETLTDQIAVAIENARLYEAVQTQLAERERAEATLKQRNNELSLLNRIIATSTTDEEPKQILHLVCRELAIALNIPMVQATLLNSDFTEAQIVAEHVSSSGSSQLNTICHLKDSPAGQYLFSQHQPLNLPNVQSHPILATLQQEDAPFKLASLLFLPLVAEDQVMGGLALQTSETRHYAKTEINLGWSVACQVASLLDRKKWQQAHRHLEEQFYQAQKMDAVGRLAGGIAHDFNNLLTVILSYSDLLLRKLEDKAQRNAVTQINKAGERAAALTNQLLSFTRSHVATPQVLNLNTCITEMDDILQRIVGDNINLTTVLEPDLWATKFDRAQTEQIIINLAMNACDAMPQGGQLTLETSNVILDAHYAAHHFETKPGEYIMLAIGDTGHGIKDDIKPFIYDPFFTTKERGQGTGLGLATVFGIVKRYGGHVWFYSEEGVGTTFKVYLPRTYEDTQANVDFNAPGTMPTGTETILLAEDDADVRKLARLILQEQGYTIFEADNGVAALAVMQEQLNSINLLLTDVIMPEMNGKILAEKASQLRPDLKILFMSGYTDNAIERHGLLDSDVTLLQKPFSPGSLAQMVRTILDR